MSFKRLSAPPAAHVPPAMLSVRLPRPEPAESLTRDTREKSFILVHFLAVSEPLLARVY